MYNNWKVISVAPSVNHKKYWLCECQCQSKTRKIIQDYDLKSGHSKSCGCLRSVNCSMIGMNNRKYDTITRGDKFNRWTIIKGVKKGKNKSGVTNFWYCECDCEAHTRKWIRDYALTSGESKSCGCLRNEHSKIQNNTKINYSFADWCKDINHLEYLERWDYDKNILLPNELSMKSSRGVWLKCGRFSNHPSKHYTLNGLLEQSTHEHHFKCSKCKSFGQWCIDNNRKDLLMRWDCKLNKISPFEVNVKTPKKYYLKCPIHKHESEKKLLCTLIIGHDSSQCNGCNSFGEDIEQNYSKEFLDNIWDYGKNNISPYKISRCNSSKKIYLKCLEDSNHRSYQITPSHYQDGRRCPICGMNYLSKLHKSIINYLKSLNLKINTEHNCTLKAINPDTNFILPYDIEIVDYKIICEIQGEQHTQLLRNNHLWLKGLTAEEYLEKRKKYDKIKKDYAIDNGYHFLELSTDLYKNQQYKQVILNELEKYK